MDRNPPSYHDATKRPDWLEFVAGSVPVREYARLCLVSKRLYHQFAPRLWNDPLTVAAILTRDNDIEWFYRFMGHMTRVRESTRALVTSLDLRPFVVGAPEFTLFSWDKTLSQTLRMLPSTFPNLRCILLDGHPDVEADGLAAMLCSSSLVLSIPQCQAKLPSWFFVSPNLESLVYLDISAMPGSLRVPLHRPVLSPINLRSLRILKARGREMDDKTACLLFKTFQLQLWSVDLGYNKLTDGVFDDMQHFSFPAVSSRTGDFEVEGRLRYPPGESSASFGKFCFVDESDWSATFSHPHRYLVDAPLYTSNAQGGHDGTTNPRLDGRAKIRSDAPDAVKVALSGGPGNHSPLPEYIHDLDICRGHQGITHLYLSGNNISAAGLARMIRSSAGQLQHLECDSIFFRPHEASCPPWLASGKAKVSGFLGLAHVFRPVISSDLQVLRIHHSLVTQLPTLEGIGLSSMEALWLAETCLLPRAELAYPESFVPDMNPRLRSLTLTQIPRYSTGPLIEKLIHFLKLAAIQEQAIRDAKTGNRRGPSTLLGLRHIRLEIEPDPRESLLEDDGFGEEENGLDTEALMAQEFSFFRDWTSSPSKPPTSAARPPAATAHSYKAAEPQARNNPESVSTRPEQPAPGESPETGDSNPDDGDNSDDPGEYMTCICTGEDNTEFTVPVWIGPSPSSKQHRTRPAVREYARLLRHDPALQTDPQPASPNHVAAGVPSGSYIFTPAWDAMLFPTHLQQQQQRPRPSRRDLRGMRDVVSAIKAYRAQTRVAYNKDDGMAGKGNGDGDGVGEGTVGGRGFHFHWTGTLEVSMVNSAAHFHQSRYWR